MIKKILSVAVVAAVVVLAGCAKQHAPVNAGHVNHYAYSGNGKLHGKLGY